MAPPMSKPLLPTGRGVEETNYNATFRPPTAFNVGHTHTPVPLVSLSEIKAHLGLLNAFAELKKRVEDGVNVDTQVQQAALGLVLDKRQRWGWFVGVAVERFDIWCQSLKPEDSKVEMSIIMPPLDVIMVWHTYMLNPRWYADDCLRIPACKLLKELEVHFTRGLRGEFSELFSTRPSQDRVSFWQSRTSQPFEYSADGIRALNSKTIQCPNCASSVTVALVNSDGAGYLQKKFSFDCPKHCTLASIDLEKLSVQKLARDLASPSSETLPGILVEPLTRFDIEHAKSMKTQAVGNATYARQTRYRRSVPGTSEHVEQLSRAIMTSVGFSMEKLKGVISAKHSSPSFERIMSAYTSEKVYSVELVGAVLRQGSFVQKMYDLGWTRPGFFDGEDDEQALHHSLARYHAFLDLLASRPKSFLVPTLDIDLVWHTHQLMPTKYEADCRNYVGRFIDHDDKVEGISLSSAFDSTSSAWKSRFGIDYTSCGCPTGESEPSIGKLLLRAAGIIRPPARSRGVPEFLQTPDVKSELSVLEASHPSDHNAIRVKRKGVNPHDPVGGTYTMDALYATLKRKKEKAARKAEEKYVERGERGLVRPPHLYAPGSAGSMAYEPYAFGAFLVPPPMHGASRDGGGCVSDDGNTVWVVGGGSGFAQADPSVSYTNRGGRGEGCGGS